MAYFHSKLSSMLNIVHRQDLLYQCDWTIKVKGMYNKGKLLYPWMKS